MQKIEKSIFGNGLKNVSEKEWNKYCSLGIEF